MIETIVSSSCRFLHLRTVHFNARAIISPLTMLSAFEWDDEINNHERLLEGASIFRQNLELVQFGPFQWRRGGDLTWSPQPMVETMGWWLQKFHGSSDVSNKFLHITNEIRSRWY
jgi:hypothetical protein